LQFANFGILAIKFAYYTLKRHNLSFYFFMTSPPNPSPIGEWSQKGKTQIIPF